MELETLNDNEAAIKLRSRSVSLAEAQRDYKKFASTKRPKSWAHTRSRSRSSARPKSYASEPARADTVMMNRNRSAFDLIPFSDEFLPRPKSGAFERESNKEEVEKAGRVEDGNNDRSSAAGNELLDDDDDANASGNLNGTKTSAENDGDKENEDGGQADANGIAKEDGDDEKLDVTPDKDVNDEDEDERAGEQLHVTQE